MIFPELLIEDKSLSDIRPIMCGEETCDPSHSYGPAMREYYLIHYVISGKGIFQTGGRTERVTAGQMFIIHPYELTYYCADAEHPWHYCWLGFASNLNLSFLRDQHVVTLPESAQIFEDLRTSKSKPQEQKEACYYLCGKIYELLSLFHRPNDRSCGKTFEYVCKAQNYIHTNYMNPISVEALAKQLCIDRSYFSAIFKKYTGKSPQQYIVNYRMEKASEFLVRYSLTPGEAAFSVGYPDIFSFSKVFRKHFGVSPRAYQNLMKAEKGSEFPEPVR